MDEMHWDIRRQGRAWIKGEALPRLRMFPARAEMVDGKLFWTDDERLTALALLLENVGIDEAVNLGDPQLWREAISKLRDN
jgi:hypothetical protein